jgi:hypothetical protein
MKRKVLSAIIIVILTTSALIGYYVEFGPGWNSSGGKPSLVYDFNSTIYYDSLTGQYYGGSFLGWSISSARDVTENETDAITIHFPGSLSRQFKAISSKVTVSFDWTTQMTMVVRRQLNAVYSDLNYTRSAEDLEAYTYTTAFDVDNGTIFTVQFKVDNLMGFLYRVKLWNSAEVP